MRIFSFYFWFLQLPLVLIFFFIIWFIPWVFVFHLGILFYFPYKDDGQTRFLRITGPVAGLFSKAWVNRKQIPNSCKAALIAAEDSRFYQHNGVDFESIQKIVKEKNKSLKQKRGGSTITQQLIKNAFLSRDRNYLRKTREVLGAVLLDATLAKEKQLEWYLNIVEFGPNTYGLESAAQRYFKVDAAKLTPAQCVSLIAILPSPRKWNQSLEKKNLTHFFIQRYKQISSNVYEMQIATRKEKAIISQMNLWYGTKKENIIIDNTNKNNEKILEKQPENTVEQIPDQNLIESKESETVNNQQSENNVENLDKKGIDSNESLNDIENVDE